MRLFEADAYRMLTRVIPPTEAITAFDVGANTGETVLRIKQEYPRATVYAFEPEPGCYGALTRAAATLTDVHAVPAAAGPEAGEIDLHVTRNRWCSSVLRPTDQGRLYYGDWYEPEATLRVPVVRLDDFAAAHGIQAVHLLKVDVQGFELGVLRGAERLLRAGVVAVNCEAQIAPEYEGASTFSEIDLFLRGCGLRLHQIHECWEKGAERQTSYVDALWLEQGALERLRRSAGPPPERAAPARVRAALRECAARGERRVALYGAGRHTRDAAAALAEPPVAVEAIIDDRAELHGTVLLERPVISIDAALAARFDAVILSSDRFEPALWQGAAPLRNQGARVVRLYPELPDPAG